MLVYDYIDISDVRAASILLLIIAVLPFPPEFSIYTDLALVKSHAMSYSLYNVALL